MKFKLPRFRFFRGIAFRYTIFFLFAILMILFFPLVIGYGSASVLILLQAQNDAKNKTSETVARIENLLQPTQLVPLTLVQAMERSTISDEEVLRISRNFILNDPYVFGTCLAFEPYLGHPDSYWYAPYAFEKNGRLKTRMLGNEDYDYFKMDWYRLPKILDKPVWSEPYFDKGGGDTLMCTYSIPIHRYFGKTRRFIGVLTMDVSLANFHEIVEKVKVSDSGYAFLVSRRGQILVSPRPDLMNRNLLEVAKAGGGHESVSAVRDMLAGNSGFNQMDGLEAKKTSSYLCYAPVASTGWSFGIVFLEKELFEDMYKFLRIMSWIFGISITLLLLTTVWITRRMTRPIVRLVEATKKIGHGDFETKLPVRKSKDEVAQLTNAFMVMRDELRSYIVNLEETTMAKEKIESELNVAHSIQMGMLPRGFTTPENWDLYAVLNPARAVGGDLYDFFYLDPTHLCIAIGDVAGKGVPASLFMMVTRTLLRAKAIAGIPINLVMQSINTELCQDNPNQMFVTFFAAVVDLHAARMEYCNAGHSVPLVIGQKENLKELKMRNGFPLGIFDDATYSSGIYNFAPGEVLVLTTDGIPDALSFGNQFYGEERLREFVTGQAGKTATVITQSLAADLAKFAEGAEQADDITILSLQYKRNKDLNEDDMDKVTLTLKNQLAELERIVITLEELAEKWKIPPRVSMELNLVLEELFTNIVFYAFDDQEEHEITLEITREQHGRIVLKLIDDGKPFNLLEKDTGDVFDKPLEERRIGGLGIHFVKEMMNEVAYSRTDNKNIVILARIFN